MLADRAVETTTTTGTGTLSLGGAASAAYRTFVSTAGSGATVAYIVEMGDVWEINYGVVTAGTPDTLTRVFHSSSTGAAVNWAAGTKSVYSATISDMVRFGAVGAVPTAGGTANALTLTHLPAMRALLPGMEVSAVIGSTNTGAATLAVDGIAAKPIVTADNLALGGGEMVAGQVMTFRYDGTSWRLATQLPGEVFLRGGAISAAGSADFTFPAGYSAYSLTLLALQMSAATTLNALCLTAGTPDTGGTDYTYVSLGTEGGAGGFGQATTSALVLTPTLQSGTPRNRLTLLVEPGGGSNFFTAMSEYAGNSSTPAPHRASYAGQRVSAGAKSGLRLQAGSGTFTCRYVMKGVR